MSKGTTIRMWRRTVFMLITLIVVGFGVIIFSLIRLQILDGENLQTRAMDQYLQDTSISAQRGTIYDCNMKPLARSASVWKVVLEPNFITDKNRDTIASGLAEILGMDKNDILKRSHKKSYWEQLKGKVETETKDRIVAFKEKNKIGNGIRLEPDYKRYYPYGQFAASVLGFTGVDAQGHTDNLGLAGVEAQYDSELTGVSGKLVTAKNAVGTDMPFQYEQMVAAQNGHSLVLTIDEVVQHFLEKYLEEGVVNSKTRNRACGIVMNVKNGAILGMAVKGDFDPNNPRTIADATESAAVNPPRTYLNPPGPQSRTRPTRVPALLRRAPGDGSAPILRVVEVAVGLVTGGAGDRHLVAHLDHRIHALRLGRRVCFLPGFGQSCHRLLERRLGHGNRLSVLTEPAGNGEQIGHFGQGQRAVLDLLPAAVHVLEGRRRSAADGCRVARGSRIQALGVEDDVGEGEEEYNYAQGGYYD